MNVAVVGPGLMGAQIGVEYALGGHGVVFVARDQERAAARIDDAFATVERFALHPPAAVAAARARLATVADLAALPPPTDLVVESIVEDHDAKAAVLRRAAELLPAAVLASNTSSLSITRLGEAAGAPERTIGTHYWNPPLLMPLVELIHGERTDPAIVVRIAETLRALGKRPVEVHRDVPGFVWNRLQLALLREAVWLVEQGIATPAAVDEIVRDGLARRWRWTGPFQTAALGGADSFQRIANNLWPVLSAADHLDDLRRWLDASPSELDAVKRRRDAELANDLARDRQDSALPADQHGASPNTTGSGG